MSTKLLSKIFQSIQLFVKSGLKRKENIKMWWEIWTKLLAGFYKHCDELKGKKKGREEAIICITSAEFVIGMRFNVESVGQSALSYWENFCVTC
jgi:hypothetical protein